MQKWPEGAPRHWILTYISLFTTEVHRSTVHLNASTGKCWLGSPGKRPYRYMLQSLHSKTDPRHPLPSTKSLKPYVGPRCKTESMYRYARMSISQSIMHVPRCVYIHLYSPYLKMVLKGPCFLLLHRRDRTIHVLRDICRTREHGHSQTSKEVGQGVRGREGLRGSIRGLGFRVLGFWGFSR